MAHFFPIAFNHGLQFFDSFGCRFALHVAVEAVGDRQHSKNEIKADTHNTSMVTELDCKLYRRFQADCGIVQEGDFLTGAVTPGLLEVNRG